MKQIKRHEQTEQDLLTEPDKVKSNATTNALLIGFLIGILIYSIMVDNIGFLSLIPLYFVHKLLNKPNQK